MTKKDQNLDKSNSNLTKNSEDLTKNTPKVTKKEAIMSQKDQKVEENVKNQSISKSNEAKKPKPRSKSKKPGSKTTKNTSKGGDNMAKDRKAAEMILRKVAKQFKLDVNRISAKRNATSDVGPLQVRKDGKVKLAVKTHDILVFSPQSYLKLGKQGPKHFEYLTVFKFETDPKILEKAFIKGLKDKKTGEEWAIEMKCRSYRRTKVNLKSRKERLEAELAAVKKRLAEEKKSNVKLRKKSIKKTKVVGAAIESVAAKTAA